MNTETIKERLESFYQTATPEQILRELEMFGVEFDIIPEIGEIQFSTEPLSIFEFDNTLHDLSNSFYVLPKQKNSYILSDLGIAGVEEGKNPNVDYAFAFAA